VTELMTSACEGLKRLGRMVEGDAGECDVNARAVPGAMPFQVTNKAFDEVFEAGPGTIGPA